MPDRKQSPDWKVITNWYVGLHAHILSDPNLAPLRGLFPVEPDQFIDLDKWRVLHKYAIQLIENSLNPDAQALMIEAINGYARSSSGEFVPNDDAVLISSIEAFCKQGYVTLPSIDEAMVGAMWGYFEDTPVHVGDGEGSRKIPLDDARENNIAEYGPQALINCPHLLEIANDPFTIDVVEQYLGAPPMILNYCA